MNFSLKEKFRLKQTASLTILLSSLKAHFYRECDKNVEPSVNIKKAILWNYYFSYI
jgi:hypothetical protein